MYLGGCRYFYLHHTLYIIYVLDCKGRNIILILHTLEDKKRETGSSLFPWTGRAKSRRRQALWGAMSHDDSHKKAGNDELVVVIVPGTKHSE